MIPEEASIQKIVTGQKYYDEAYENNDSIKQLNSYLNSDYEESYEDYVPLRPNDIPSPVLLENGNWKIPGTTKEFETATHANNAASRYTEKYFVQDQASILVNGVGIEEYETGDIPDAETATTHLEAEEIIFKDGEHIN